MKRYIYMIETQKPTGTTRFLKSFDTPLVVNGTTISERNKIEVELFNDRTETYSYITTLDVDIWADLINAYYDLVSIHKVSLEFTKDNYVYLIQKKGPVKVGGPYAHLHPQPIDYNCKKKEPLPFYPEKDHSETQPDWDDTIPAKPAVLEKYKDFFNKEWYESYCARLRQTPHRPPCYKLSYYYFESFILTFNEYYNKTAVDISYHPYFKTYRIEAADEPHNCPFIFYLGMTYSPTILTYQTYIAPYYEGKTLTIMPDGTFYTPLEQNEMVELYQNFLEEVRDYMMD